MSERTETHTAPVRGAAPAGRPVRSHVSTPHTGPRIDPRTRRAPARGSLSIAPPLSRTTRRRATGPALEIPERLQLERLLVRDTIPQPVDRFTASFSATGLLGTVAPAVLAAALATQLGRSVVWYELVLLVTAAVSLRLYALIHADSQAAERRGGDGPESVSCARAARTALLIGAFAILPLWLEQGLRVVLYVGGITAVGASFLGPLVAKRWQRVAMPLMQMLLPGAVLFGGMIALTGRVSLGAAVLALQLACARALIAAVEGLRDQRVDLKRGRVTWMTFLGPTRGRRVLAWIAAAPLVLGLAWLATGAWWMVIVPILASPPLVRVVSRVFAHEPGPIYNLLCRPALVFNYTLMVLSGVGLLIGA